MAQAPGIVAAGLSNEDGFGIYVSLDGDEAQMIHHSSESVLISSVGQGFLRGGLSADGALLCLEHSEHGDLIHPALRVVDPRTGTSVGEQMDAGMSLTTNCWSPVPGDARLAFDHEREGDERPGLWDLASGERTDLELDLEGAVWTHDWWPDGSALLLVHRHEGRDRLLRYDLRTGDVGTVFDDSGVIWSARVRPDGTVWLLHELGHRPRLIVDDSGNEVLRLEGTTLPARSPMSPGTSQIPTARRSTASS